MFGDHPRGLATLFFTEMWERLSYYGMRGILLLFLVANAESGGMGLDGETGAAIYGLYTAMVYLLALPGGWIADRVWGKQKSVFWGGVIIAAGHFSMAIPMTPAFYLGLVLIVIGTGLLKPNVSAIIGDLYPEGGARRDAGFSIFYMGINIGALAGPLICGYLGEQINWHLGFSAAGIGMVFGLVQYRMGLKYLGNAGELTDTPPAEIAAATRTLFAALATFVTMIAMLTGLHVSGIYTLSVVGIADAGTVVIVSVALAFFAYVLILGKLTTLEKKRTVVIFFLFIGAALFWSGFEQAGSSMNLFADRLTNRTLLGFSLPASWFQSINPLFIIIFAPIFGSLWVWLANRNKEPSIPAKFGLGLVQLAAAFIVMAWASTYASEDSLVSPNWLIVTYFLQTTGELCLSPVGLSSVTKLAPKHLVSQMMGIWFIGAALGNLIAGRVAGSFETLPLPELFGQVALTVGVAGLVFLAFSKLINSRLIGNLGETEESIGAH